MRNIKDVPHYTTVSRKVESLKVGDMVGRGGKEFYEILSLEPYETQIGTHYRVGLEDGNTFTWYGGSSVRVIDKEVEERLRAGKTHMTYEDVKRYNRLLSLISEYSGYWSCVGFSSEEKNCVEIIRRKTQIIHRIYFPIKACEGGLTRITWTGSSNRSWTIWVDREEYDTLRKGLHCIEDKILDVSESKVKSLLPLLEVGISTGNKGVEEGEDGELLSVYTSDVIVRFAKSHSTFLIEVLLPTSAKIAWYPKVEEGLDIMHNIESKIHMWVL